LVGTVVAAVGDSFCCDFAFDPVCADLLKAAQRFHKESPTEMRFWGDFCGVRLLWRLLQELRSATQPESGSRSRFLLQQTDRDERRGNQEDHRPDDPHDDRAGSLISEWRYMEGIRLLCIVALNRTAAEVQES
jgi:hypothetical protein